MLEQGVRDPENKLIAILKTLNDSPVPLGSDTIARRLRQAGTPLSERTVRFHLKMADERGFTRSLGRGGRLITPEGRQEVREAMAPRQMGSVVNKFKMLAYQTTFDPAKRAGLLPVNVSILDKERFKPAFSAMEQSFRAGYCVSPMAAVAYEGEQLASVIIPRGKIGLATVCSVAINGVLLKAGIPTEYKYCGVLETKDSRPRRFITLVEYAGTSLDPSEEFISAGITAVGEAARTGDGKVLTGFRLIPLDARAEAEKIIASLTEAGIGGVCATGTPDKRLCEVSIDINRFGIVQLSGINPVAAACEAGIGVVNFAGSGLLDFRQLKPFYDLHILDFSVHRSHCQGE